MAERGRPRRGRIEKKGTFVCENCGLSTPFHSFGQTCPFAKSLVLLEEAFVARDPFNPDPQPLILGSQCTACRRVVCVSSSCSVFYTKRFCIECVKKNLDEFPKEIQQELAKSQQ
jgi:hypothetical protein